MKAILILLAALLLLTCAVAKEPKVGDFVNVKVGGIEYEGKITGLSNGLLCMEARLMKPSNGPWVCFDRCFGIGQIVGLKWLNETEAKA